MRYAALTFSLGLCTTACSLVVSDSPSRTVDAALANDAGPADASLGSTCGEIAGEQYCVDFDDNPAPPQCAGTDRCPSVSLDGYRGQALRCESSATEGRFYETPFLPAGEIHVRMHMRVGADWPTGNLVFFRFDRSEQAPDPAQRLAINLAPDSSLAMRNNSGNGVPSNAGAFTPGDWFCLQASFRFGEPGSPVGIEASVNGSVAIPMQSLSLETAAPMEELWFGCLETVSGENDISIEIDELAIATEPIPCIELGMP